MGKLALVCLLASCASSESGPVQHSMEVAASEANVPIDLVAAVAVEEGGLMLPAVRVIDAQDNVPTAGRLELRHGRLDTLALGARLVGASEAALRTDTDLGTRAGARVLAFLGATDDPSTWRPALEQLSGMRDGRDYASRVLAILHAGGTFHARGGESIRIPAHAEIAAPIFVAANARPDGAKGFAGAIWFDTSCTNKCTVGRPLGNDSVDTIVIHDTEGGWDASVATLQNDSGKSVHYIVDADGSRVGQFRAETDTTWHAGNYYYNETSVGIEHVGVASDPAGYSDGLYATSQALVQDIRTRWNVPLDRTHIIGHYQIPNGDVISESSAPCTDTLDNCENSDNYGGANNHRDPGFHWQWCQYMQGLGGTCTCNDAWPLWNCTTDGTEAVRCNSGTVEIQQCSAGCVVMPIGQDDQCNVAATPDAGTDPGSGSDMTDPGTPKPGGSAGCATSGGGAGLLVGLALLGARRRRTAR
jgi:N-acetyl-anhydromuramyl-L-alanine amidase AmpD